MPGVLTTDYISVHSSAKNRYVAAIRDWRLDFCLWLTKYQHVWRIKGGEQSSESPACWYQYGKCRLCGTMLIRDTWNVPVAGGPPPQWSHGWEWLSHCGDGPETREHVDRPGNIFDWAEQDSSL